VTCNGVSSDLPCCDISVRKMGKNSSERCDFNQIDRFTCKKSLKIPTW